MNSIKKPKNHTSVLISDESVKWYEMWTEWNPKTSLHPGRCIQMHRSKSGTLILIKNLSTI